MKLTIIIVNYNVRFFVEQTLRSVFQSKTNFEFKVCVVDNASSDGSVEMIKEKFPDVDLRALQDNNGFSAGNNVILRELDTPHVLLLNPDTIISEHTLQICMDRMERQENIGGLGVRMIDGGGQFLPESKRGLPTPWVAFCKAFGLSKVFPKSQLFNQYHLGHINEMEEAEVSVLSGAFMWMRKAVLDKVGLLDEAFFMYGEDIDLSYRIEKAGFVNLYLPTTSIIHFKGESTKKGSINYVKVFYNAMIIFAKKHFVGQGAFFISFLYQMAVWFRATLGVVGGLMKHIAPVILDAVIILFGLRLMTWIWANYYFGEADYFSSVPLNWHHGLYTGLWLFAMYMGGAYDHYFSLKKLRKSLIYGTVFLFLCFSVLPNDWRPSRAVLLLGSIWTWGVLSLWRAGLARVLGVSREDKRLGIVGSQEELDRARKLMESSRFVYEESIFIAPARQKIVEGYVGGIDDLKDISVAYRLDELIFCTKDVDHEELIRWMTFFSDKLTVRIIPEAGTSMIASRYKNTKGELHTIDGGMRIVQPEYRRQKRCIDMVLALVTYLTFPLQLLTASGRKALASAGSVLIGGKTWVGYEVHAGDKMDLPKIKTPVWDLAGESGDGEAAERMYYLYARDYSIWMDLEHIWRTFGWAK